MRYTDADIDHAAQRLERLAEDLDPNTTDVEHTDDLREVALANEAMLANHARLREAVAIARAHGRSWNDIALRLGVTRQAARQRYTNTAAA